MNLNHLIERPELTGNKKLNAAYLQFNTLICELSKKELPENVVQPINRHIAEINDVPNSNAKLRGQIRKKQSEIIKLLEKELKIVTKGHYRNTWLVMGIAAFGIPMGLIFAISLGNMAFLGIGLPIGLAIGIAIGTKLDAKAEEEGRQLDIELKH